MFNLIWYLQLQLYFTVANFLNNYKETASNAVELNMKLKHED